MSTAESRHFDARNDLIAEDQAQRDEAPVKYVVRRTYLLRRVQFVVVESDEGFKQRLEEDFGQTDEEVCEGTFVSEELELVDEDDLTVEVLTQEQVDTLIEDGTLRGYNLSRAMADAS